MKVFLNILGCLAAILCSVVLVAAALLLPAYTCVTSLVRPDVIADVVTTTVKSIDLSELLPSAEDVKDILPLDGVTVETIEELMETEAVSDAIELYAGDLLAALGQEGGERQFTAEALKGLIDEHVDDLVDVIKPYLPDAEGVSDEEIAAEIQAAVDTHADTLVEELPIPDLSDIPGEIGDALTTLQEFSNAKYTLLFIAVIVFCALIIFFCRLRRFGGVLWLGVLALLIALPCGVIAFVAQGPLTLLLESIAPAVSGLIAPIVTLLSANFTTTAVVCAVIGVVLIVTYIFLRHFVCAKTPTPPQPIAPPEAAPAG